MPYGIRRKSIRDPMNNVERRQVELKKELVKIGNLDRIRVRLKIQILKA